MNGLSWKVMHNARSARTLRLIGLMAAGLVGFLLASCGAEPAPLPTAMSVAVAPTRTPTALPPTQDLRVLTVTPPPTATRLPTATPTPVRPLITITEPKEEATLLLESRVTVRGLAALPAGHTVEVALVALNGRLLTMAPATLREGGWLAELEIPPHIGGAARLAASIHAADGAAVAVSSLPVMLAADTETAARYLTLNRPLAGETAVSSFFLLFDGAAAQPVNRRIFISVWTDDCQRRVAAEAYEVRGSGSWQGFVVVPRDAVGPGCAIAAFGEPESDGWREVQLPLTIAPRDAAEALGIRIGGPAAGSAITAGATLLAYGVALNVEAGPVNVSVLLENGRILSQATAMTDYWGYWELPVVLPPDVSGPAQIIVTSGTRGERDYAEDRVLFTIEEE